MLLTGLIVAVLLPKRKLRPLPQSASTFCSKGEPGHSTWVLKFPSRRTKGCCATKFPGSSLPKCNLRWEICLKEGEKVLCHPQNSFHFILKTVTLDMIVSVDILFSHAVLRFTFSIAAAQKRSVLTVCHIHFFAPVNPTLIQLTAGTGRHGTLALAVRVQNSPKNLLSLNASLFWFSNLDAVTSSP